MIRTDQRVAIVGKTGSGKSYLARALLASVPRLVICDAKGTIRGEWGTTLWSDKGYRRLLAGENIRLHIPPPLDEREWDALFWLLYKVRGFLVYIDELYGVGPPDGSRGLRALYTRGRELGIGVWAATQRPAKIPLFALSEAEHIILFQINMPTDQDRMADLMGGYRPIPPLRDHNFVYYNDAENLCIRVNRLDVKKLSR